MSVRASRSTRRPVSPIAVAWADTALDGSSRMSGAPINQLPADDPDASANDMPLHLSADENGCTDVAVQLGPSG